MKIQVVPSVELGIQGRLGALPMEEERELSRMLPRPQVPYEVNRILVVVVYPLSTKRNDSLVSHNIDFELNIYRYKPISIGLVKTKRD